MESEVVDVERAWLEAGKARDVDRMRELRAQHPMWLDLNRQKGETRGPETSARASSWEGFRLSSIGVSSIHAAAWDGSVEVIRFLLESGQHPDSPDDWGMTPLMVTVMRLFLVTMRSVFRGRVAIQRNLVVDCRDEDAVTIGRTLEIARVLESYGSDPHARNAEGKTALHIAAFDDGFEVAKYLLARGIGVDIQDHNGQTALHHSINAKSLLVTNLLLESGASIDTVDESGASPLSLVVSKELTLQLQLMLNHHQLVATSSRFDFATAVLHEAVDKEAVVIAAFLLENRYTSVSSQDADGESALHRALRARNIRMLRELREFDEDDSALAARTRQGESCFHFAARFGGAREVEILLDKYCTQLASRNWAESPLNWANAAGETALMIAGLAPRRCRDDDAEAEDDRATTVQMLKQHGARLFPADSLRWKSVRSSSEQVLLPACARRCLCRWLVEDSTPEVCYDWVSSVEWCSSNLLHQDRLRRPSVSAELVNTLLDAGYATDAVQLLVLLPMKRSKVEPLFLDRLRSFAGRQRHELLLELVESLTAAWRSEAP